MQLDTFLLQHQKIMVENDYNNKYLSSKSSRNIKSQINILY